jgi:hypothetical protein
MDYVNLALDRNIWRLLVNAVLNFQVSQKAGNFLTIWRPVDLSERTAL